MQGEGARGEGARGEAAEGGRGAARGVLSWEHDHRWVLHLAGKPSGGAVAGISRFRCPGPSTSWTARREETTTPGGRGDPRDRRARPRGQRARGGDPQGRWPRALEHLDVASEGEDFEAETKEGYDRLLAVPQTGPWLGMKARPRRRRCASTSRAAPRWGAWRRARRSPRALSLPALERRAASASASASASAPACTLCAPPQSVLPPGGSSA